MGWIDKGRNTLSFVKDEKKQFLNDTFILDKALGKRPVIMEWSLVAPKRWLSLGKSLLRRLSSEMSAKQ